MPPVIIIDALSSLPPTLRLCSLAVPTGGALAPARTLHAVYPVTPTDHLDGGGRLNLSLCNRRIHIASSSSHLVVMTKCGVGGILGIFWSEVAHGLGDRGRSTHCIAMCRAG